MFALCNLLCDCSTDASLPLPCFDSSRCKQWLLFWSESSSCAVVIGARNGYWSKVWQYCRGLFDPKEHNTWLGIYPVPLPPVLRMFCYSFVCLFICFRHVGINQHVPLYLSRILLFNGSFEKSPRQSDRQFWIRSACHSHMGNFFQNTFGSIQIYWVRILEVNKTRAQIPWKSFVGCCKEATYLFPNCSALK